MYTTTLRQFEQRVRQECMAEYGITGREYDDAYPAGSRSEMWVDDLMAAVKAGDTIGPRLLDMIADQYPRLYRHLCKFYPASIPTGYMHPATRRMNLEQEATMRAARSGK